MRLMVSLAIAVACGIASVSYATPYRLAHTFRAEEPEQNDFFGTAVAIEGGVIAIKSHSGHFDGDQLSITHVYEQDAAGDWNEAASFEYHAEDNLGNAFIGEELAIDDGVIAVGYGDSSTRGTSPDPVQVLTRDETGWSRSFASLAPLTRERLFARRGIRTAGRTVGISGDLIIAEEAGVQRPDRSGNGVARVFEKQADGSWLETANLFSTDSNVTSAAAAAIDGTTAALVYRQAATCFCAGGGVYFFERQLSGEWLPTESFPKETSEDASFFFDIIDIDGDTAVTRDLLTGSLTTYERSGGVWRESTGPPPSESFDIANGGFAQKGNLLARTVGGTLDEPASIEVYRRDELGDWNLQTTISDPAPDAGLDFGWKLAIDGNRLLVGAMSTSIEDLGAIKPAGAAYLFVAVPEPTSVMLILSLTAVLVATVRRAA